MVSQLNIVMLTAGHVGGIFFFNKKKETTQQKKNPENVDTTMICKFVVDGSGKKIGESVSVADDVLIIKSGSQFLGVPLKHVDSLEKTLVVKGVFDFTKAYELGEKWRKESYREMNQHDCPEEKSKRL
jgi:uncharacterized protein YneF (UPF0154 family)